MKGTLLASLVVYICMQAMCKISCEKAVHIERNETRLNNIANNPQWGKTLRRFSRFLSVGMNNLTVKIIAPKMFFNCWFKELPYFIELRNSLNFRYYVIVRICTVKVHGQTAS